jgi:hypothetical protein
MAKLSTSYHRLSVEDAEQHETFHERPRPSRSRRVLITVVIVETLLLLWFMLRPNQPKYSRPALVYCRFQIRVQLPFLADVCAAPAQDAVEYGITTYAIGGDKRFHVPPSPALDEAWSDLYNCTLYSSSSLFSCPCPHAVGISQVPKSEASRLPNKTHPIPGDEANYVRWPNPLYRSQEVH